MSFRTVAPGIHQSDIVIRAAILRGIEELRATPWALRYVFASLADDDLTNEEYGQKQIDEAIKWFMNTEIPVFMAFKVNDGPPPLPCVSIALMSSNESEATLGDVHYDEREDLDEGNPWPVLLGPVFGASYDVKTGRFELPAGSTFVLSRGQVVTLRTGKVVPILKATGTKAVLPAGINADFDGCCVRGAKKQNKVLLESLSFNEQYVIGCHAKAEPSHLIYLHSIVVFILLRYKQTFLEARGYGESTIQSTDLKLNEAFKAVGLTEPVYSRYLSINGKVRNYWPKDIAQTVHTAQTLVGVQGDDGPADEDGPEIDLSQFDGDPLFFKVPK